MDRLEQLLASKVLNGIDFVEIATEDQKTLKVHFLNTVAVEGTLTGTPTSTGGETISNVTPNPVQAANWTVDALGNPLLTLTVPSPGDFSNYTLTLQSPAVDPFYSQVPFSFKALCTSTIDCATPAAVCEPSPADTPPIEYMAKDYNSFKQALLDFSALQYPDWRETAEADFGMMFLETMSAIADDLSYTQDRVASEAFLSTATQRRSLLRLGRLVDYEVLPPTSASVLLQFTVGNSAIQGGGVSGGPIYAGTVASAQGPDGSIVEYETGESMIDPTTGLLRQESYPASPLWNQILPYYWDDSQACLSHGSTDMWVLGVGLGFYAGQALLIDTSAVDTADPPVREIVHITSFTESQDALFPGPPAAPTPVTHIFWDSTEALQYDHDLTNDGVGGVPRTVLAGNLVPATQGRRYTETFAIGVAPANSPNMPVALVRNGANSTPDAPVPMYIYSLAGSPLAWIAQDDPTQAPLPEIVLSNVASDGTTQPWIWRRTLLDAAEFEDSFTVDPAQYTRTALNSDGSSMYDYSGDSGYSIRFGDGIFGEMPDVGSVFRVTYRVGGGAVGNVAANSINKTIAGLQVTNPLAAVGGADAETPDHVQQNAPYAFSAQQFRAVRSEDYQAAAQTLPWVDKAGAAFRWTGSWKSIFVTADPVGGGDISLDENVELIDLLNRYRMAGYECFSSNPQFAALDLQISVCAQPDAFQSQVQTSILDALTDGITRSGQQGFFYPDHFTFGTALARSALEAAIQGCPGVLGVVEILVLRRGLDQSPITLPPLLPVPTNWIIRCNNDPSRPELGSIAVSVGGGK